MFTQMQKDIIISALDMKLASIKRAKNANTSPRFKEIYNLEETETNAVKMFVQNAKLSEK